jgi:hypothetical protein
LADIIVESWEQLQDWLFEGAWNPVLKRHRSIWAFRGSARAGHGVHTSLARLGGDFTAKEQHLIRNFRKYARRSLHIDDSMWNWLALAKHHGLPTRLLDWTFSPYVALHFATADHADFTRDGEILAINFAQANRLLPRSLRKILDDEGSDVFTAEMLSSVATSLRELDSPEQGTVPAFLEPPSLDGASSTRPHCSLMSNAAATSTTGSRASRLHRTIVLPAQLKWEVRDKLDQANIRTGLVPRLDGLSAGSAATTPSALTAPSPVTDYRNGQR